MASKYKIIYEEYAEQEFAKIYDYIAYELYEKNAADKLYLEYKKYFETISRTP